MIFPMGTHFQNKDALSHVLEKRAEGMLSLSEAHGTELPGRFAAASDASKEMAIVLMFLWVVAAVNHFPFLMTLSLLAAFGFGWLVWKAGRSGWLGWSRLERLHRLIEQEKYEIEHHRPQEREELLVLYRSKGFEGKLLEDVVDVLMADQDRLLKVMLEEEMGLTLNAHEHPIEQTLGAAMGAMVSLVLCLGGFYLFPSGGLLTTAFLLIGCGSAYAAVYEKNRIIHAIIWNVSLTALSLGSIYFLYLFFK